MEKIGNQKIWSYFDGKGTARPAANLTIRAAAGHRVSTYFELAKKRKAFDKARRRALARLRECLDLQWTPPKSRDELHER